MTCIVGLIAKNDIYLGVDSASADNKYSFSQIVDTKKLVLKKDMMLGYTSSWRMGNVLEHEFKPPPIPKTGNLEKYMVVSFVGALRKCFKDAGFTKVENNEENAGSFLAAIKREKGSKLFEIQSDFSVLTPISYASAGSGALYALASLKTTEDLKLAPTKRVQLALEAAAHFNAGVRAPFKISSFKDG